MDWASSNSVSWPPGSSGFRRVTRRPVFVSSRFEKMGQPLEGGLEDGTLGRITKPYRAFAARPKGRPGSQADLLFAE